MKSAFDSIKQGLNEAIEFSKGKDRDAKVTVIGRSEKKTEMKRAGQAEIKPEAFEGIMDLPPRVVEDEIKKMREEWERG